jgi:hypothetical protein
MNFLKIKEPRELKLINLDQICFVSIGEKAITFHFVTSRPISYTELQLGTEEFKKLESALNLKPATVRVRRLA